MVSAVSWECPAKDGPCGRNEPQGSQLHPEGLPLGLGCAFNSWNVQCMALGLLYLRLPVMPLLPAFLFLTLLPHGRILAGAELCGWHGATLRPALCTVAPNLGEETREREARWGEMWVGPHHLPCSGALANCLRRGPSGQ